MTKQELKKQIEEQKEINIKLYKSIPLASVTDPLNKKADPILEKWRAGSKKLKELINKLYEVEKEEKKTLNTTTKGNNKTFINGFGEATKREITTNTYRRAENRLNKEILSFMGSR